MSREIGILSPDIPTDIPKTRTQEIAAKIPFLKIETQMKKKQEDGLISAPFCDVPVFSVSPTNKWKIVCQKAVLVILVLILALLVFHEVYGRQYLKERRAAKDAEFQSWLNAIDDLGMMYVRNINMIDAMPGLDWKEKFKLRCVATEFHFDSLKKLNCEYSGKLGEMK